MVVFACSCNRLPNKPFYEPLTLDELSKAIKADSAFADFYEDLRDDRSINEMSDVQKAKYRKVTYARLYKYMNYANDWERRRELDSISSLKWEKEYASEIKSTDSLINVMKQERATAYAKVNEMASFELVGINYDYRTVGEWKKPYEWSSRIEWVEKEVEYATLSFMSHLSVPTIDEIKMQFFCWGKDGYPSVKEFWYWEEKNLINEEKWVVSFARTPEPFDKYGYSNFIEKFDYAFKIDYIIIGKDTIKPGPLPTNREFVLEQYDKKFGSKWMDLAKKNFNEDMPDQWDYCYKENQKALQKYDALVYALSQEF